MRGRRFRGGSLLGLLFLLFLILKIAHVIDWSWWWVTAPLWLPLAVGLGVLVFLGLLSIVGYKVVTALGKKQRQKSAQDDGTVVVEAAGSEASTVPTSVSAKPALPAPEPTPSAPLEGGEGEEGGPTG